MAEVIALQALQGPEREAADGELEKISELSFFVCGPFPSEVSAWGCI